MPISHEAMSDRLFYTYVHPLQNSRFYLALVFSLLVFPVIAVSLIVGTVFLIVPLIAFFLWVGTRIFFAYMLGNSILVSNENYPRINSIGEELKVKMGYERPIFIFVYESGSFNAYMGHFFFRRAIFLNSELLQSGVSDNEIRWIIGRFIGYLRARKQGGVLGWVIRAAQKLVIFNIFVLPYERAMVCTGDRLAVAQIDGDIASAISAMQKLMVGRELGYSVNPQGIIAQQRQVKGSIFALLARLLSGFPHVTSRYVDLILFAKVFFPDHFAKFEAANPGFPVDLPQLALSPQSSSSSPHVGHPPRGWVCVFITAAIILGTGFTIWSRVPSVESYAYQTQPDSSPSVSSNTLPPNIHLDASGKFIPDAGCRWLTNDATDLRVVCE